HHKTEKGIAFHWETAMIDDTYLNGNISAGHHTFVDHFKFVKALEDENTVAKQTIPAPAQFLLQMIVPENLESTRKFYPTDEELIADIAKAYQKVIRDFYEDRKSTRLNSSHVSISYAVFCLKKKTMDAGSTSSLILGCIAI